MAVDPLESYSNFSTYNETLSFKLNGDYSSDEILIHAYQVYELLHKVIWPVGFNLWLTCAIEATWITVNDPEPADQYWQIRGQETSFPAIHDTPAGLPFKTRMLPQLARDSLLDVFHEALKNATCPDGFFVTFNQLAPTATFTRIVDDTHIKPDGSLQVTVYDKDLALHPSRVDDTFWLSSFPDSSIPLPPVDVKVTFDSVLIAHISVNWSRWGARGTGEHQELETALRSMTALGWQPGHRSHSFDL
jgi:hypothetical protein